MPGKPVSTRFRHGVLGTGLATMASGSIVLAACGADGGGHGTPPHSVERALAPLLNGSSIEHAENTPNITVESVDVGPELVEDVDGERSTDGDWRIVAYCPDPDWGVAHVAVVQEDEFNTVVSGLPAGTSIAENTLVDLLDCPV